MVLGARLRVYGGGRWRKITGVEAWYSENFGNYLLFDVRSVVSPTTKRVRPYGFSTRLSTPNYAPVSPLPGATIKSDFKLELKLRLARRSTNLVNEGYGSIIISYYFISLGRRNLSIIIYYVEIRDTNVLLSHSNFITQLPIPILVPVSVLL